MDSSAVPLVAQPTRAAWTTLAVLVGLCTLAFIDRQIIALMVGPIRSDLHISDFEISLLQGLAFGLFYAAAGIPLGWLVDRFSRRWVIWWGVAVWSLATMASGLTHNFWHLFLARLMVGAGEASLTPAAYSMIADHFPKQRLGFALSVYSTGANIGSSLAYMFGGVLLAAMSGIAVTLPGIGALAPWQLAFIALGLPGLAIAFLIFCVTEPQRQHRAHQGDGSSWGEFFAFLRAHARFFACQFVGCGMVSMIGYGYLAWLPAYLMRHYELTVAQTGLLLGPMVALPSIIGGVLSGIVADRMFARGRSDAHVFYWSIASLVIAGLSVAAFSAPTLTQFVIVCCLVQALLPFSGVNGAALQIIAPSRFRGRLSSLFILTYNLFGLCAGASVVAFFTDYVYGDDAQVGTAIATTAVLAAPIAAVLFHFARRPMRQAVAAAEAQALS